MSKSGIRNVVEVFRYTAEKAQFEAAVIGGADYPQYQVEPLKLFSGEREAEEHALTLQVCEKPEPGGIVRVVVRALRDDDLPLDGLGGEVFILGTKDEPWR